MIKCTCAVRFLIVRIFTPLIITQVDYVEEEESIALCQPRLPRPLFVEDFVRSDKPRSLRSLMKEWLCAAALFGNRTVPVEVQPLGSLSARIIR